MKLETLADGANAACWQSGSRKPDKRLRNWLRQQVLLLCTTAICLLLAACGDLETSSMSQPFVTWATFKDDETLLYVVRTKQGHVFKSVNVVSGEVEEILTTRSNVFSAVQDRDGVIYYTVVKSTPRGRGTQAIVVARPPAYSPEYLFTPDEAHRNGLTLIDGEVFYIKSTNYAGAFGGGGWAAPYVLTKYSSGNEVAIGEHGGIPNSGSFSAGTMLPLDGVPPAPSQSVMLVDTTQGKSYQATPDFRGAGRAGHIESLSLSPDASQVLIMSTGFGHAVANPRSGIHYAISLIDLDTGATVDSYVTARPILAALYSPAGDIYFVEWLGDEGSALYKWEDRENTFVMQLK